MDPVLATDSKKILSSNIPWKLINWLYPPLCIGCGSIGFEICDHCISHIERIDQTRVCPICGVDLQGKKSKHKHRGDNDFFLTQLKAFGYYCGLLKEIIQDFKYHRRVGILNDLMPPLMQFFESWNPDYEVVIPVPLSKERKRERGYNQSAILAKKIALLTGKPYSEKALFRIRDTHTQVGLNPYQRHLNVKDAFQADKNVVAKKSILLIDDITTTGSTINECAKSLRIAGTKNVFGFTLARAKANPSYCEERRIDEQKN